ncbi:MAG: hypothetical protein KC486_23065 [Myxococcales bacterium]|nr:hypothetical protein [Myxococcales bacterium]
MPRARADKHLVNLGSTKPRGVRAVLKFVDLERDRAYGVELHIATRSVRPRLMGALWIHGETFKLLAPRLRDLAEGLCEEVVLVAEAQDTSVRLVRGDGTPSVVISRPARREEPAREVSIPLEEGQLAELAAFLADVARRL